MNETQTQRESIARKIRALRERTTAAGCTEAEALSAAGLMQKLMDEYGVTLDEAEVRREGIEQREERAYRRGHGWHPAQFIAPSIAKLTGAIIYRDIAGKALKFTGTRVDVEYAQWLYTTLAHSMDTSELWWAMGAWPLPSDAQREGFRRGMVERLIERIRGLIPAEAPSTGHGLIVLKGQLTRDWLKARGVVLQTSTRGAMGAGDASARNAGRGAADGVNLGRPLGSSAGQKQIGRA